MCTLRPLATTYFYKVSAGTFAGNEMGGLLPLPSGVYGNFVGRILRKCVYRNKRSSEFSDFHFEVGFRQNIVTHCPFSHKNSIKIDRRGIGISLKANLIVVSCDWSVRRPNWCVVRLFFNPTFLKRQTGISELQYLGAYRSGADEYAFFLWFFDGSRGL